MSAPTQPSGAQDPAPIHFRPGAAGDLPALHRILIDALWDLAWRIGIQEDGHFADEEERAEDWLRWRPILDHFTATADQFWVAEQAGEAVGYARSILRQGVRELTEFFVSPHAQTAGIGRELLARAMPPGAHRTYIMATLDLRAQARYHKLGVYQICAVYAFYRKPEQAKELAQLPNPGREVTFSPLTPDHLPVVGELDLAIHGHRRDQDHAWLMQERAGFLMLRQARPVGYGYVGSFSGPFVVLDPTDFAAALAYAENIAAAKRLESFGVDVPMLNHTAIDYLLGRGYQMSPFFCFYMCDEQPQHVDKTIITSPMIMM